MKGDKLSISRYRVKYTNKEGKRISRIVRARTGDNAWLVVKKKIGGKNIQVNKLSR